MSRKAKFYCLDPKCGWSNIMPGKGMTCKRCGGPAEKRIDNWEQLEVVNKSAPVGAINMPIAVCPYANLPYRDIFKDNPVVRLYQTDELHYGLIFRNRKLVQNIYCPNCNKLLSTNAKIDGQYDTVCKNKLPAEKGGGKCGAKVTLVFYTEQFKEKVRDEKRVERPPVIRNGHRREEGNTVRSQVQPNFRRERKDQPAEDPSAPAGGKV